MTFEIHSMKTCEKCRETYRHLQCDLPTIANTENMSENILQSRLDKKQKICTFMHLSSRNRYAITVDNMPDISISVSSSLTFCEAFSPALQNE